MERIGNMFVYYNGTGIGDVLLYPIKSSDKVTYETFHDVVKIMDEQTKELVGYNIFHASHYFRDLPTGKIKITEELLENMREAFQQNEVPERLTIDLSPKFVVGYIKAVQAHQNADKLKVCQVDVGEEELQIVCGAPNVDKDQKVVVAKVGAIMPSGLEIKPTQLRGVDSFGMICSQKELGLPDAPKEKGIYVLPDDKKIGSEFEF